MVADPSAPRRMRVRLHRCETEITRDGRCLARIGVEWMGGRTFSGSGEGTDTPEGRVRAGVEATVQAAEEVCAGDLRLELRGVKVVRAFDAHIVIVSIRAWGQGEDFHLLGSTTAPEDDLVLGGTLSVLDATNRILERYANRSGGSDAPS